MEHSAAIKSAHDGTTLELSNRAGDYYRVGLSGPHFHGACQVYCGEPRPQPDKFFRDLAADWRGWQGKREWSSLEGELKFSATCDSSGHTSLSVQLRSGPYPLNWSLSAVLLIEAGSLEGIASEIQRFFGEPASVQ
jgi:hypothetical protein